MQAAIFEGPGQLTIKENHPKPSIYKPDQALIRVTGVGICGTDLHILQEPPVHPARAGIVLGHEFTGVIEELGDEVRGFDVGESVLIDPHPGCGYCAECRRARPDQCITLYSTSGEEGHPDTVGIFSDGAMGEYTIVSRQSLYKVDKAVPSPIAALAEPLACVVNATGKLKPQPGDFAVILGAGPIGLIFSSLLLAGGVSKLVVSEPSEYRRNAAKSIGADIVVHPDDLMSTLEREMPQGADIAVEAVGSLLPQAIRIARSGGRVMQFGHDETANPQIPLGEMLKKELVIYGAFIGRFSFEKTARIMESGKLPLDKIVSHTMPLSRVHEAIDLLRAGQALKVILQPGS